MAESKNKENHVIWGVYESKLYIDDLDFHHEYMKDNGIDDIDKLTQEQLEKIEEEKFSYYSGDFWSDCDSIRLPDDEGICTYDFVKCGNEIIMGSEYDGNDMVEKILLHYFSKDWNDKSITPEFDRGDWNADLTNGSDADCWIKYRGGQGYCYAFCGYNTKDFE